MLRRLWHDPVWSKVIATGTLALLTYISISIQVVSDAIFGALDWCIASLSDQTTIPNYYLVILVLLAVIGLVTICILVRVSFFEKEESQPEWMKYKEDVFYDLVWRWEYSDSGDIRHLHTLCPKCHCQMNPTIKDNWPSGAQLIYRCDSCGFTSPPIDGDYDNVENRITRFIQKNLRTGEWSGKSI